MFTEILVVANSTVTNSSGQSFLNNPYVQLLTTIGSILVIPWFLLTIYPSIRNVFFKPKLTVNISIDRQTNSAAFHLDISNTGKSLATDCVVSISVKGPTITHYPDNPHILYSTSPIQPVTTEFINKFSKPLGDLHPKIPPEKIEVLFVRREKISVGSISSPTGERQEQHKLIFTLKSDQLEISNRDNYNMVFEYSDKKDEKTNDLKLKCLVSVTGKDKNNESIKKSLQYRITLPDLSSSSDFDFSRSTSEKISES